MISHLTGILRHKSPTEIVVDISGIGFSVNITLSTYEQLGQAGSAVTVLTHLHMREDVLQLYGFATEQEREMFRLLLSVSGIGPKIAQGILSGIQAGDLHQLIVGGNAGALTAIPGVGRKTAERLLVELKDKVGKMEGGRIGMTLGGPQDIRTQALMALTSLGFTRSAAEGALRNALQRVGSKEYSVQELVKLALKATTT